MSIALLGTPQDEVEAHNLNLEKDTYLAMLRRQTFNYVLTASKLVEDFEAFNRKSVTEQEALNQEIIEKDFEKIQEILLAGKGIYNKRLSNLLTGGRADLNDREQTEADGPFNNDVTTKGSWGIVARHEIKIMKKAARLVEKECRD